MQDGVPTPDEANEWLHQHFRDDPDPSITLTWEPGPPLSRSQRRTLLEILFGPDSEDQAA